MTKDRKVKEILKLARELAPSRGGRPKKGDAKNRTEVIKIRASKKEKEILHMASAILETSCTSLLLDQGVENAKALLDAEGVKYQE